MDVDPNNILFETPQSWEWLVAMSSNLVAHACLSGDKRKDQIVSGQRVAVRRFAFDGDVECSTRDVIILRINVATKRISESSWL